ncbi:MAG: electron transfer flavoprotein subunit beta/FixA family protein [Treponemataceae bacterium]|nr:MAG: electron transfer flavoprotein subunit beta/FixA family protein [Treponemataceae bacterium]
MRIAVCLKQVPDTRGLRLDPVTNTLVRGSSPGALNPSDISALEAAWRIQKTAGGGITALTMGPPQAVAVLKEAARQGAERLLLVSDTALAGSDTYATAMVLKSVIQKEGVFDLVFCGRRSIDGETGQVGPELAALLGVPCVTNAVQAEVRGERLYCRRITEDGQEEAETAFPVLVTFCECFQAHPPALADVRRARTLKPEMLALADLALPKQSAGIAGSKTRVARVFPPPKGRRSCVFAEDEDGAVQETARLILRDRKRP